MWKAVVVWLLPVLFVLALNPTSYAAPVAQTERAPTQARVVRNSNLRAGPGTSFAIVGYGEPGQLVDVLGCNRDCTWYQLAPDCWIAAFLVAPVGSLAIETTVTAASDLPITVSAIANPTRCPQTARVVTTYAGPGAFYDVVDIRPQGLCVAVVGRDQGGAWLQLSHGMWLLAADVRYAEPLRTVPVTDLTRTPTITPRPTATPITTLTPAPGVAVTPGPGT